MEVPNFDHVAQHVAPLTMMADECSQNPTYDDMMLLTSLLGPVKPPVASQEDVEASPGIFCIVQRGRDGNLVANSEEGPQSLQIPGTERCQVCLTEYEVEEKVRQLGECAHVFHRECIETVSLELLPSPL